MRVLGSVGGFVALQLLLCSQHHSNETSWGIVKVLSAQQCVDIRPQKSGKAHSSHTRKRRHALMFRKRRRRRNGNVAKVGNVADRSQWTDTRNLSLLPALRAVLLSRFSWPKMLPVCHGRPVELFLVLQQRDCCPFVTYYWTMVQQHNAQWSWRESNPYLPFRDVFPLSYSIVSKAIVILHLPSAVLVFERGMSTKTKCYLQWASEESMVEECDCKRHRLEVQVSDVQLTTMLFSGSRNMHAFGLALAGPHSGISGLFEHGKS